jgi:phage I-like protein
MVSLMSDLQRHKLETVSMKAERDSAAKELESEIAELSRKVDTGKETRMVPVATLVDMSEGLARVVRQDTMEFIQVRPLEQHERQGLLWGGR